MGPTKADHHVFPNNDLLLLINHINGVIRSSLWLARKFGKVLKGVRLDTSKNMVCKYYISKAQVMNSFASIEVVPRIKFCYTKGY
ncbi:hypothetical protein DFR57_12418 [Saliterribacillus persicus]|uniref:Uncharacterized protein n=1 Tax=Saliterribacillus persicus TaxID=930114 RepID=A0A368X413_9BACI|nr:hypothetical protein DFR57_12418 [Saliterribacillus persicus]